MVNIQARIEGYVLAVHRRNGGTMKQLNPSHRLLEPSLLLDSLDLAEIMVAIEKEFGDSPFETDSPPRTWEEVAERLEVQRSRRAASRH
ncbi:MAG: hypothetical protein M1608_09260 [Candidatus Omnitrophica bacterium]|nr:hypothetical protein [Candidatus Omnitrophota bacterium]